MKKLSLLCAMVNLTMMSSSALAMNITDSWLNFREAYMSGSDQFQTKIEYGMKVDDVLYFSIQNTSGQGDSLDEFNNRYNEVESNYKIPLTSRLYFWPGFVFNWGSNGSAFDPYVKLGVQVTDNFMLIAGYRYNQNNYQSTNIYENQTEDANQEINLWADVNVTDRIWMEYNFTYHKRDSNFRYGNGTTENYEHTIALSYKVDDHFTPYIDVSQLDKASNGDDENRVRIGLYYHF
ncbi:oligogalacturonate-specific porin KdgM family protein [Citrobacter arsenatis]|uniref:oligogalacturonate-specific porin KdgM family protein n=1 Tax=Citrobacter arsenatis TaxID=2546350 RepID=UPI00300DE901